MKYSSLLASLVAAIVGLDHMAMAIQLSDFTKLNSEGGCADSKGNLFTSGSSPAHTYTNDTDMENYCLSYCGQNIVPTFRGFETIHLQDGPAEFLCVCLIDMPTFTTGVDAFPYVYTPAINVAVGYNGTGAITGTKSFPAPGTQCYKFNGNATNFPTKAPTVPATEAPTKPFSCPVGRPSCVGVSDCTPYGLRRCVASCCANIGSKTAKSSKRV